MSFNSSSVVRRRVHHWLAMAGLGANWLSQSGVSAEASGIDFFDPSAVREANRDAIIAAGALNQSGFVRILRDSSPSPAPGVYDLSRPRLQDASAAGGGQTDGDPGGNIGFPSDTSEPSREAARPVGSTRLE